MTRLILIGICSALFFSSTFVLNRAMSLQGGHWIWTASLRYFYMFFMLSLWLVLAGKSRLLKGIFSAFRSNWCFWTMAGSIGFGVFYALLTFSSSFAPGWVVATTWQATILATPLVLLLFGKRVPMRGIVFTALIFIGIVLVTCEQASAASIRETLLGVLPVLVAAFAYPLGNQLIWEARHGKIAKFPESSAAVLDDSVARVLIMVLGSIPFWIVLTLFVQPPPPSGGQLINTAVVAVLSGVIATTLFYKARHLAKTPFELSAVDATQSTEVIFSLLGEILFLGGAWPGAAGMVGITLSLVGLVLYVRSQTSAD
ncbi:multidrug resistance efflux transporter family protein [Geomonas sp. Red69]|uniref:Multidrug resistance efflux transporter family protein n=1 Tax=Geomonas diazotrophica TaxID=2843197 RepID=A0ABX8JK75_9BACT|nr:MULTISPECIES: multidrug resistance efflux transporter family protein [Geomonas]MBU5635614.1 multidrug resistance efflux transporter family protein [Geomonas diazotrophica]QWV98143.1 multidrug resistance efflux transporter family protein [Geomonas nitrogeniifigens]